MSDAGVPLQNAPFLELTDEQLRAIVDRHECARPRRRVHSIIDWDDAGWGDPAMDLASLPRGVTPKRRPPPCRSLTRGRRR
jgi:hypothetical protein